MNVKRMGLMAGAVAVVLTGGASAWAVMGGRQAKPSQLLLGDDFGRLRREALAMFPRGLPVAAVTESLTLMGFQCAPARRLAANINAPSVQCDSAGRGYPVSGRMQVTVMSRNGALSDIAIGSGMDAIVADARTPDPAHGGGVH